MIRVCLVECRHHLLEDTLAARDFADAREGEGNAERVQALLELAGDDVAQGHRGRADLRADHLESAGQAPSRFFRPGIGEVRHQLAMLGDGGYDRHQVRLARAVVADDQKSLVVGGPVELELGEHQGRQLCGHLVGDHVAAHQLAGGRRFVGVADLNHGLNRIEPDQVFVLHGNASRPITPLSPHSLPERRPQDNAGTRDGWVRHRRCDRLPSIHSRSRLRFDAARDAATDRADSDAA